MRIAAVRVAGRDAVGVVEGDSLAVIAEGPVGPSLLELIEGGATKNDWCARVAQAPRIRLNTVQWLPPVVSPYASVLCVGKNYYAHAREFFGSGFDSTSRDEIPTEPVIFAKTGSCVVGHGATVFASLDPTGSTDYEGELAVVIGRTAHNITRAGAWDVIFGYTICNDVTSRELQKRHSQWLIGKSLDSFGPLGPWIVTADEVGDITAQTLVTTVNGEERQRAAISDLIFDIPRLIETLTATMTLQPGDIIATGTPAGVGIGHKPPRYLKPGDRMEVSISGIGTLANTVA